MKAASGVTKCLGPNFDAVGCTQCFRPSVIGISSKKRTAIIYSSRSAQSRAQSPLSCPPHREDDPSIPLLNAVSALFKRSYRCLTQCRAMLMLNPQLFEPSAAHYHPLLSLVSLCYQISVDMQRHWAHLVRRMLDLLWSIQAHSYI